MSNDYELLLHSGLNRFIIFAYNSVNNVGLNTFQEFTNSQIIASDQAFFPKDFYASYRVSLELFLVSSSENYFTNKMYFIGNIL